MLHYFLANQKYGGLKVPLFDLELLSLDAKI